MTEYLNPPLNTLGDNFPQKRSLECGSSRFLPKFRTSSGAPRFRVFTLNHNAKSLDPILHDIATGY